MKRYVSLLLYVFLCTLCYAQIADTVANKNMFYVESQKSVRSKYLQSEMFFLYDHKRYIQNNLAIKHTLISCEFVDYKTTGYTRKYIVFNNKDSIAWENNKLYIKYIFEHIANKEDISNLDMIEIKVPADLCLSISCGLEEKGIPLKKYNGSHSFQKLTPEIIEQNKFVKENILSSYLLSCINSILSKYQLTVDDVEIDEPTLLFDRKNFIKLYPVYSDCRLPKYILGLYCCFILKKQTGTNNHQ